MAQTRTIRCENCGEHRETTRRNTKYCQVCRLFIDLMHLGNRTRSCRGCDKRFGYLNKEDLLCADCRFPSKRDGHGECKLCGTPEAALYIPGLAVCNHCARDIKQRDKLVRSLRLRVARTQDRNGVGA